MIGAEAVIKSLEKEGVECIFGYPGATIAPFYNELAKSQIRHILVRHEQHAGHAASGYARITGRPGVCSVTSGPGATNLITALGTAYMDSIPLVAITGQVDSALLGRDVFQEADITGATASFTKYSYLVKNPTDLPGIVKEAFHIASTGRQGPVLIDIPVDVLRQKASFVFPDVVDIRSYKPTIKGHAGQIKRVLRALNSAAKPVICVGGGIFTGAAQDDLIRFAERLEIPVVTTLMGIGALPTAHRLNMGMVGMHGKSIANQALNETDLLLLLGARVSDRAVLLPMNVNSEARIIHIDIDPAEIGKNITTFIPVVGDLKTVIAQIMELAPSPDTTDWVNTLTELKTKQTSGSPEPKNSKQAIAQAGNYINPKIFVNQLTKALPNDYIYVADVGQNQLWSAGNCDVRSESRFMTTGGMGTMGYAIGSAIGAKMAAPDRFTVAVCGDGGFQMSMMELATICQHNVDVKIIVMINGYLGLVREIQANQYANNLMAVDLSGSPDPLIIASAYGIPGRKLSSIEEAPEAINDLITSKGPFLLACTVSAEEPSL